MEPRPEPKPEQIEEKIEQIDAKKVEYITNNTSSWSLKSMFNFIVYSLNKLLNIIRVIIKISGIYVLWILLHYTASQLYIKYCTPEGMIGLLMSPFLTSTPHCQGLRWLIYNGAIMINHMWLIIGTWFCANLLIVNNNKASE